MSADARIVRPMNLNAELSLIYERGKKRQFLEHVSIIRDKYDYVYNNAFRGVATSC